MDTLGRAVAQAEINQGRCTPAGTPKSMSLSTETSMGTRSSPNDSSSISRVHVSAKERSMLTLYNNHSVRTP